MDHHCPWINNCVGFDNRKFFLQMLIYVICTTAISGSGLFIGLAYVSKELVVKIFFDINF